MNLNADDVTADYKSGLLHDIGKIGVDDSILRKTVALNDAEFAYMSGIRILGVEFSKNCPPCSICWMVSCITTSEMTGKVIHTSCVDVVCH